MPWINARADVICTDLLLGDIGAVDRAWPDVWEAAAASHAWERWLVGGRLAAVRAAAALEAGRFDDAFEWSSRTIEMARPVKRRKYQIDGTITLGRTLAALGRIEEAVARSREAIALADGLGGSPLLRWRARAAFADAALKGADSGAEGERRLAEAVGIIEEIAAGLNDERAARYRAAPQVVQVMELV